MNTPNNQNDDLIKEARDIIAGTAKTLNELNDLSREIDASKSAQQALQASIDDVAADGDVDQAQDKLRERLTSIDVANEKNNEELIKVSEDTQKELWREQADDQPSGTDQ